MVGQQDQPNHLGLAWWGLLAAFVVGCVVWFLLHPIPPTFGRPPDPRGWWVSGRDTLIIDSDTSGTLNRTPFSARTNSNRMLLALPNQPDGVLLVIERDSIVMTSGFRTLLHEGDTVRVFRR